MTHHQLTSALSSTQHGRGKVQALVQVCHMTYQCGVGLSASVCFEELKKKNELKVEVEVKKQLSVNI